MTEQNLNTPLGQAVAATHAARVNRDEAYAALKRALEIGELGMIRVHAGRFGLAERGLGAAQEAEREAARWHTPDPQPAWTADGRFPVQ